MEESTNHIAHSLSLYQGFRGENMKAFCHFEFLNTKASVSVSIVSIHTRSEDPSDSDSDSDSTSVACVSQSFISHFLRWPESSPVSLSQHFIKVWPCCRNPLLGPLMNCGRVEGKIRVLCPFYSQGSITEVWSRKIPQGRKCD